MKPFQPTRLHLSLAFILTCSFTCSAQDTAIAHVQAGERLGHAGNMQDATVEFRRAIRLKNDYPEAHYLLALSLIADPVNRLDWPQAAAECQTALKDRPDYPEAAHLLGVALAAMGQQANAINAFKRALQLRPQYPEGHLDLGMAYAADRHPDLAVSEYKKALAARPGYAVAHQLLAKSLLEEGKSTEALSQLYAALRLNPDLGEAHYLMGRILLSMHQGSAAKLEFQQVQQLDNRRVLTTRAIQLSNAGLDAMSHHDIPGALQDLRQAVTAKPDYAIAHYNLGLILADSGNLQAGISEVQKAISLAPLQSHMRATLQRMSVRAGDRSIAPYAPLPETPRRHLENGHKFAAHADTLGAIGEYLRALQLDPSDVQARCALATAYRQAGEVHNAMLETAKVKLLQTETSKP